ncbi:equilibrative nucleobase transporter 1-like isoform X2 [Lineus longissimus]|uniref:equilibrative nucleobase transporter 1-like isoform X2 n=1 Tax=Lineus longissimus TaxID=88925 RepID=UPI00315DA5E2
MACSKNQISLFFVLYCSVEILLFAGAIFGWHSLNYVLKKEGYFAYLCPDLENRTRSADQKYSNYSAVTTEASVRTELTDAARNRTDVDKIIICDPQDSAFNLIFTLAVCITGGSVFFCGFLFDKCGSRFCRYISLACAIVSFPLIAFSTPETSVLLYPGMILFSFGCYILLLSNLQVACLIPAKKSTFMCVMCGSFDAGSAVFLTLKISYAAGFSLRSYFLCMFAMFMTMVGTSTILLHPKYHIKNPLPPDYEPLSISRFIRRRREKKTSTDAVEKLSKDEEERAPAITVPAVSISTDKDYNSAENVRNHDSCPQNKFLKPAGDDRNFMVRSMDRLHVLRDTNFEKALSLQSLQDFADVPVERRRSEELTLFVGSHDNLAKNHVDTPGAGSVSKPGDDLKQLTFKEILLSGIYMLDLFWISVLRLRSWFFMGTFNPQITFMAKGDDAIVSHYTSVFAIMQFFGFMLAPISGRLMDRKKRKTDGDPRLLKIAQVEVCVLSFALDSFISVLMSIGACIPILEVQYVTCALSVVQRAFMYGPNSAFIAQVFPLKHFGKLFGMYMTVSSVFSLLQFPMFILMQGPLKGDPLIMNVILLVLMVLSFIHPVYLWWFCRSSRQKFKKEKEAQS